MRAAAAVPANLVLLSIVAVRAVPAARQQLPRREAVPAVRLLTLRGLHLAAVAPQRVLLQSRPQLLAP